MKNLATFIVLFQGVMAQMSNLRDCVRPWQEPMLSIPLISDPSRPVNCHPDTRPCPKGRNEGCQFSLRSFKYICCQDKEDADPPVCPKYHETLLVTCGSEADNACPKGFRCLGSRFDESVRLCCKPNDTLSYPEPETTFRDNRLIPLFLPVAPKVELTVTFGNLTLAMGQLLDVNQLNMLEQTPEMTGFVTRDEKMYTIVLYDTSAAQISWLVANIPSVDKKLDVNKKTKANIAYAVPDAADEPEGMHVMILLIFEQSSTWGQKELAKIEGEEYTLKQFIEDSKTVLVNKPVAGTFYGYSTRQDNRAFVYIN